MTYKFSVLLASPRLYNWVEQLDQTQVMKYFFYYISDVLGSIY
jgi:hypothetical protein